MEIQLILQHIRTLWNLSAYRHALMLVAGKHLGFGVIGVAILYLFCRIPRPLKKSELVAKAVVNRITLTGALGSLVICSLLSLMTFKAVFDSLRVAKNGEATTRKITSIKNYLETEFEPLRLGGVWRENAPAADSGLSRLVIRYFLTLDLRYVTRGAEKKIILAPADLSKADFAALLEANDFFPLKQGKDYLITKQTAEKIASSLEDTNALNLKLTVFILCFGFFGMLGVIPGLAVLGTLPFALYEKGVRKALCKSLVSKTRPVSGALVKVPHYGWGPRVLGISTYRFQPAIRESSSLAVILTPGHLPKRYGADGYAVEVFSSMGPVCRFLVRNFSPAAKNEARLFVFIPKPIMEFLLRS